MAQLNYFLIRKGLRPIPHLNLDLHAIISSYTDFRGILYHVIKMYNPEVVLPVP